MNKQLSMLQNDTYAAFVDKFKPKKTTDDCYTPANVYEAVLGWVVDRYNVDPDKIDRPFWPGGDYESFSYTEGGCVVDNPPFSLLTGIIDFYNANGIKYFLFAPYLTNFNSAHKCCHIITPQAITYENGARVDTAFVTNLDERLILGDVDLYQRIREADRENTRGRALPKYQYPDNVLMASDVGYMVKHGVNFETPKEGAVFIRQLDSQIIKNKTLFGGGFLVNDEIAKRRAEAEETARRNAENEKSPKHTDNVWKLSEREKQIIKYLGNE